MAEVVLWLCDPGGRVIGCNGVHLGETVQARSFQEVKHPVPSSLGWTRWSYLWWAMVDLAFLDWPSSASGHALVLIEECESIQHCIHSVGRGMYLGVVLHTGPCD